MTIQVTPTKKLGHQNDVRSTTAPEWSKSIYLRIPRQDIGFVRFLMESYDHLAYLTVVDKYAAVIKVIFAPGQEQELHDFIRGLVREVSLEMIAIDSDRKNLQNVAAPRPRNETIR
ncbi:MAG: DUF4911 domain-containing protein [Desulfovibrionales bacterium]